ncbi:hypothetical protein AOLI_G00210420 [Acnodon oligacanthus]
MAWTTFVTMETTSCPSPPHQNGDVLPLKLASSAALQVHLYYRSQGQGQGTSDCHPLTYPPGDYVAEELCIKAAKECGISPLYCSLFALMRESDRMWYPPNHIFKADESTNEKLLFRIRFYFPGWYGSGSSSAHRYGVTKSSEAPVLDDITVAYLFAQVFMEKMGIDKQGQMIVYHLIDLLKHNYRLPTPEGCPAEVHSLMKDCWAADPSQRPSFKSLGRSVDTIRESKEG